MKTRLILMLSMTCVLVTACASKKEPEPTPIANMDDLFGWQPQTPDQLRERYDAAVQITNLPARDKVLKGIAVDSANADNAEYAEKAVNLISAQIERDDAASYCAQRFDDLGHRALAEQFVSKVNSSLLRDRLHERFASKSAATTVPAGSTPTATKP